MDLLEYNASLIWNIVPFGSIMFAIPESSIKFAIPDMVLTLTFVNVKSRKYLLSRIIMCGFIVSKTFLRSITHEFKIKLNKTINNINNNVIDVITR